MEAKHTPASDYAMSKFASTSDRSTAMLEEIAMLRGQRAAAVDELREAQAAASEACAQLFDLAERGDASHAVRDARLAVSHLLASQKRLRAAIAKATGAA